MKNNFYPLRDTALFFVSCSIFSSQFQRPIVVVIPSYNNACWCEKNLASVFMQQYDNYRVICIDDCSTEGTYELVKKYVADCGKEKCVTIIKNKKRRGSLYNHFKAVRMCADEEIVVQLDGDDWFAHENVLTIINEAYENPDVWLTYGQHETYPTGEPGICALMPEAIIQMHAYREFTWITSAPRTFYAWLFKHIKLADLVHEGDFFAAGGDLAFMFPMLEMATGRIKFIDEVLYIYNCATPNNDYKKHLLMQKNAEYVCRGREKYESLISQPRRDENEQVDCVILSRDNPLGLLLLLRSIGHYCSSFKNIYVFYESNDEENEIAYGRCAELFSSVLFSSINLINFKKELLAVISDKSASHVVFASDEMMFTQPVDLNVCVSWLQQTHAHGFFLSLGKNIKQSDIFECKQKQPDFVELDDTIFAWQPMSAEGDWRCYNNCALTLYKKSMLRDQFKNMNFDSIKTFLKRWEYVFVDSASVGLCFDKSVVVRLRLQKNKSMRLALFDHLMRKDFGSFAYKQNDAVQVELPANFLFKVM